MLEAVQRIGLLTNKDKITQWSNFGICSRGRCDTVSNTVKSMGLYSGTKIYPVRETRPLAD